MKKGMALCVVLFLLLLYIKPPEKTAASLGNIFVWYSDQSIIGRWSQSSIKIYANKLNTNATFYFDQAFTTARSEWQSALGIYLPIKPLENECPIRYYGGTVAELTALGWTVSSYTAGTNKPLAGAKNVTLHELGHALGWRGHSAVSSDIMYSLSSSISLLTNRDKDHLSQVY